MRFTPRINKRLEIPNIFEFDPKIYKQTYQPPPPVIEKLPVKVLWEKDGGLICFYENVPVPLRGFMFDDIQAALGGVKRTLFAFLWFAGKCPYIFLIPGLRRKYIEFFVKATETVLAPYRIKLEGYTRCNQELYKKTLKFLEGKKEYELYKEALRRPFMILEYDPAYRTAYQLFFETLHETELQKDPKQELRRALKVFIEEQERTRPKGVGGYTADNMRYIEKALTLLFMIPGIKKRAKRFFKSLDFGKIIPDATDNYWLNGQQ